MKKFVGILFVAALILCSVQKSTAQSTTPRFGTSIYEDNTYRVLTLGYSSITTGTATAVLYQKPNSFHTIYQIGTLTHALTDSLSITNSYVGDEVTFIFNADATGRTVTFGNHIKSAGTLAVPSSSGASGEATATFVFDGVQWTEKGRAINTN